MDRQVVYAGAIPQDVDQLQQNINTMVGFGYALQAILGKFPLFDGLACTARVPPALAVTIAPGSVYSVENIDDSAYGSISADTTDQIIKQGISSQPTFFNCPAPTTSGFSLVYLIEAAYDDVDTGAEVLPYYNASNPAVAFNGPNNSGTSQDTVRKGNCLIQMKAGVAAPTGTQATPTPDAGFTGLYAVTVANGQSTITSGNIVQLPTAPFINVKLGNVAAYLQSGAAIYAADTSGAANTIAIALSPIVAALTSGQEIVVKVANTNTAAVLINTNGLGNVSAILQNGNPIPPGTLLANGVYAFIFDGTSWQLQMSAIPSQVPVGGAFKNLKILTSSVTASTITADELILENSAGGVFKATSVNVSYSTGAAGANGLDTGSLATSTWYNEWVIYNPSSGTLASLLSTSASAPTMPSGYTYKARVGAIYSDSGRNLRFKIQFGRDANYVYGTNPAGATGLTIFSGAMGSVSTPTYISGSVSSFVPPTAAKIKLTLATQASVAIAAPNATYGTATNSGVPMTVSGTNQNCTGEFLLESTNVYFAGSAAACTLAVQGWTDNL